jgi:hypothetical protein
LAWFAASFSVASVTLPLVIVALASWSDVFQVVKAEQTPVAHWSAETVAPVAPVDPVEPVDPVAPAEFEFLPPPHADAVRARAATATTMSTRDSALVLR